jgi:hypothetical protein
LELVGVAVGAMVVVVMMVMELLLVGVVEAPVYNRHRSA